MTQIIWQNPAQEELEQLIEAIRDFDENAYWDEESQSATY